MQDAHIHTFFALEPVHTVTLWRFGKNLRETRLNTRRFWAFFPCLLTFLPKPGNLPHLQQTLDTFYPFMIAIKL